MEDNIPTFDSLLVQRQKKAGCDHYRKNKCAGVGNGIADFQSVVGPTFNPLIFHKTCAGVRGGAVALACGMIPLADGSDMGGSLRNPGSFVMWWGLRTSPGRVP